MSADPEMGSIAGRMAWRAIRTYNPSLGVPAKRYLAVLVKRAVWDYWRKVKVRNREEQKCAEWWAAEEPAVYDERVPDVSPEDWELLVRYHVDKWPLDVMARRFFGGTTVYSIRKHLRAAEQRFRLAVEDTV